MSRERCEWSCGAWAQYQPCQRDATTSRIVLTAPRDGTEPTKLPARHFCDEHTLAIQKLDRPTWSVSYARLT